MKSIIRLLKITKFLSQKFSQKPISLPKHNQNCIVNHTILEIKQEKVDQPTKDFNRRKKIKK